MSFSSAEILVSISLLLTSHIYFNRDTSLFIIWNLRLRSLAIHCMGLILLFFTKTQFYVCIFLACPRFCSHYFPLKVLVSVIDIHICEMLGAKSCSQLWTSLCLTLDAGEAISQENLLHRKRLPLFAVLRRAGLPTSLNIPHRIPQPFPNWLTCRMNRN